MQKVEKDSQPKKITILPLRNQKSFDVVNKIGNKLHGSKMLIVSCQANEELSYNSNPLSIYLGLKISKKLGKAVTRNKIRRRIKSIIHSIAQSSPNLLIAKAFIIIPRKGFDSTEYSNLHLETLSLIEKSL